jgi:hypothetical protein
MINSTWTYNPIRVRHLRWVDSFKLSIFKLGLSSSIYKTGRGRLGDGLNDVFLSHPQINMGRVVITGSTALQVLNMHVIGESKGRNPIEDSEISPMIVFLTG